MKLRIDFRRRQRFFIQMLAVPLLWTAATASPQVFTTILAAVIVFAWPASLGVALVLWLLARSAPEIDSLTDAADDLASVALGMTALAGLAFLVLLQAAHLIDHIAGTATLVLLSVLVIALITVVVGRVRTVRQVWVPMVRTRIDRDLREKER